MSEYTEYRADIEDAYLRGVREEAYRLGTRRERRLNIGVAAVIIVGLSLVLWGAILYPLVGL